MKTTFRMAALATLLAVAFYTPAQSPRVDQESGRTYDFGVSTGSIKWKNTDLDLGSIEHSKPKTIEFEFTNTGDVAVIINQVQAGCGCTSVNYPKEPVAPGATAKITAIYNAAVIGAFNKHVTVNTSAEEGPRTLTFKGTVI